MVTSAPCPPRAVCPEPSARSAEPCPEPVTLGRIQPQTNRPLGIRSRGVGGSTAADSLLGLQVQQEQFPQVIAQQGRRRELTKAVALHLVLGPPAQQAA